MNAMIGCIAAEAEKMFPAVGLGSCAGHPETGSPQKAQRGTEDSQRIGEVEIESLGVHQFPSSSSSSISSANYSFAVEDGTANAMREGERKLADILREYEEIETEEENRRRRIYRARTIAMLRRYLKYSMETGRLPSLLGQEFFRAKMTTYPVATFEDRVIFVHDMERCLERLDEFSRELIARHVLQEHDQEATAKLLHCTERTVRRLVPVALDQFCKILLRMRLLERMEMMPSKTCQGGLESEFPVSDCEESENKF